MASQNDTMRGPTNYYRTGTIRFDEEKGLEHGSPLAASTLTCVYQVGVFRRRTNREPQFSSSEETKTGRTRRLCYAKASGCIPRQG
jgi:hypothetical protein